MPKSGDGFELQYEGEARAPANLSGVFILAAQPTPFALVVEQTTLESGQWSSGTVYITPSCFTLSKIRAELRHSDGSPKIMGGDAFEVEGIEGVGGRLTLAAVRMNSDFTSVLVESLDGVSPQTGQRRCHGCPVPTASFAFSDALHFKSCKDRFGSGCTCAAPRMRYNCASQKGGSFQSLGGPYRPNFQSFSSRGRRWRALRRSRDGDSHHE